MREAKSERISVRLTRAEKKRLDMLSIIESNKLRREKQSNEIVTTSELVRGAVLQFIANQEAKHELAK